VTAAGPPDPTPSDPRDGVDARADVAGDAGRTPPVAPGPVGAQPDPWTALRRHTPARIGLGRAGAGLPTAELLRFAAAHAAARDAVHVPLDAEALAAELQAGGWTIDHVHSQADDRATYLRRPDLGRRLSTADAERLKTKADTVAAETGLVVVLADGLSAVAVQRHAPALLRALRTALAAGGPDGLGIATPIFIARQARVALADELGALCGARLALILIGERPGLSSPDSLGAYLTWSPRPGRSDAERNCVSNIRPEGLPMDAAASRLAWLLREADRRRLSGVGLKDDSGTPRLPADMSDGPQPPAVTGG